MNKYTTLFKTWGWPIIIAAGVLGVLGQGAWDWYWRPRQPVEASQQPKKDPPRESVLTTAAEQREELNQQKRDAALVQQLKKDLGEMTKTVQAMKASDAQTKEALARVIREEVTAGVNKIEARATQRAQETMARKEPPLQRPPPPPPAPKVAPPAQPRLPVLTQPSVKLTITPAEKWDGLRRSSSPQSADMAHLFLGCHAKGVVVTGVEPSSREGGAMDMLFFVKEPFECPFMLQGPGENPRPTAVPIQGCMLYGHGSGDLVTSRVHGRLERLSCVMSDKRAFVADIKGFLTDIDGNFGVVGERKTHASAAEAKAFLAGLMQEASALLSAARSTIVVTPYGGGGGPQPFQGFQSTLQQLGNLYIQQIQYLLPTLYVQTGKPVYLWIVDGTDLPGLPTSQLVQGGSR